MIDMIIAYENGEMSDREIIDFFQDLVNTGVVWSMQGHYGRMAQHLIDEGVISAPEN